MKKFSLKAKLFILAGSILFFSVLVGIIGTRSAKQVAEAYGEINTETLPMMKNIFALESNLNEARIQVITLSYMKDTTGKKFDEVIDDSQKHLIIAQDAFKGLKKIDSVEGQKVIKLAVEPIAKFETDLMSAIMKIKAAEGKEGPEMVALRKIVDEDLDHDFDKLDKSLKAISGYANDEAVKAAQEAERIKDLGLQLVSIINIVSLVIGVLLTLFITNDLLKTFTSIGNDLGTSSQAVGQGASHVAISAIELSQATTEQASAIEETAASIEEMSAMVTKNAESSKQAVVLSKLSEQSAHHGQAVVKDMINAIEDINISNNNIMNQVNESNKRFQEIVNVIQEIGNKTKVINDIVFQTKLLSFNASVEAARAGEHGKGFAVVAEEIGNLAQMSGVASKDISDMLEDSIKNVDTIVHSTRTSVEKLIAEGKTKVTVGTKVANECGVVLNDIVTNVAQVTAMSEEISHASQEQSKGVSEVGKAMNQLDEMTQKNATTTSMTAGAAEQLSKQSEILKGLIKNLLTSIEGDNSKTPPKPKTVSPPKVKQEVVEKKKEKVKEKAIERVVEKRSEKVSAKSEKNIIASIFDKFSSNNKKAATPPPPPIPKVAETKPKSPVHKPIEASLDLGLKTNSNSTPANTPSHDDSRFTDV